MCLSKCEMLMYSGSFWTHFDILHSVKTADGALFLLDWVRFQIVL